MKKPISALLIAGALFFVPTAANAALIINMSQNGLNVFVDGKGSINTTGLKAGVSGNTSVVTRADLGAVMVGPHDWATPYFYTLKNKGNFGSGNTFAYATNNTGDTFGLYADRGLLFLPPSYVSGSVLSGVATYANSTLASLRLTQGSYLFNLINGDTITVNVGAVPEPATWALMTLGMAAVGFAMRRRRKVATTLRLA